MENQDIYTNFSLQMLLTLSAKPSLNIITELDSYEISNLKILITRILVELESAAEKGVQDTFKNLHNLLSQCIYYVIRIGNTQAIELIFDRKPGSYFNSRPEELDALISYAYKDLKIIKNVQLESEMEFCISKLLLNLRFFAISEVTTTVIYTQDDVSKRICFVSECVEKLRKECLSDDDEEKFALISRHIALNIFILKKLLKRTYLRIPWEEMEFCLISYIQLKNHQPGLINFITHRTDLLNYLESFSDCLTKETKTIENISLKKLRKIPVAKRDEVIKDIQIHYPLLKELYLNYELMRDNYSLRMINKYVELAISADPTKESDQLVIMRSLQVIGENLKNTLESPKLSSNTSDLLIFLFPFNTSQLIKSLRNSLSHGMSLFKYQETNENDRADFFVNVQKDLSKITTGISHILHRHIFKVIQLLMKRILNCNNTEELTRILQICDKLKLNRKNMLSPPVRKELKEIEVLVSELENKMTDLTNFEENSFKKIKKIVSNCKREFSIHQNIYEDISFLLPCESPFYNLSHMKYRANLVLDYMKENTLKVPAFEDISDYVTDIWNTYRPRERNMESLHQIWMIVHRIIWITGIEAQNVKHIEKLNEILNNSKNENNIKLEVFECGVRLTNDDFLISKIKLLKNIINEYDLNCTDFLQFSSFKNNSELRAKIEILVFAILSVSNDIKISLPDNLLLFDNDAPFIGGKNLRDHLAHGNSLTDVLFDSTVAIFLNAKFISGGKVIEVGTKTGMEIKVRSLSFKTVFERDMHSANCQKQLFLAVFSGSLQDAHYWILKGADISGRDNELRTTLHYAATSSNVECLKFLLCHGLNINDKDIKRQSILHVAAASGRKEITEFLISEQRISIHELDHWGRTPLHLAAENGCAEVVSILLFYEAKSSYFDQFGFTPLHYAANANRQDTLCLLLKNEKHVDSSKVWGGFTPLHLAAEKGHLSMVDYLITNGADVNVQTIQGATALHNCVFYGHLDVVEKLILHGANVNAQTNDGRIPLHNATEKGYESIVEVLLKHGSTVNTNNLLSSDSANPSPMCYAVSGEYLNIVKMLIRRGADVENCTDSDLSPLHYAVRNNNEDIIKILLESGANVNVQDKFGRSPLHYSIDRRCSYVTKLLIKYSAYINIKDNEGLTPVHYAAELGSYEAMLILVSEAEATYSTDKIGNTPLHSCAISSQIPKNATKYFMNMLSLEEDTIQTNLEDEKRKIMDLLFRNGANMQCKNNFGQTPLHLACLNQYSTLAEYLVNVYHKIDIQDKIGYTPLHYAVESNNLKIVKILITINYDQLINSKSLQYETPLCIAVKHNYSAIVEFLVEKGADVNLGKPLHIAVTNGFQNVTKILFKAQNINISTQFNIGIIELAASNGHEELLAFLLAEIKKNPNFCIHIEKQIKNALILAFYHGHLEVIKLLLKNETDVNKINVDGTTLMHIAAKKGDVKMIEILIKHGANFDIVDEKERLPLEMAVSNNQLNVIKLLFEHQKLDINVLSLKKYALLHIASQFGCLQVIKYLVDMGANIYSENSFGSKPIHIAARDGHIDIVEYFLNCKVPLDIRSYSERNLLHYAADGGHGQICEYLIKRGIDVNSLDIAHNTPIHVASSMGHIEAIKILLHNGAYVNCVNMSRHKPLDISKNRDVESLLTSTEKLFDAVRHSDATLVERYIKMGAAVNAKNSKNASVLHYAAWKADENIVGILLRNNCNPNIKGKDESMPIHYASKYSTFEAVRVLLENGAIFNSSCRGQLPIQLTVDKKIRELLEIISNSFKDIQNDRIDVIDTFRLQMNTDSFKAFMNAKNIRNNTIIVEAIRNNFSKMGQLTFLLQQDIYPMYFVAGKYETAQNYNKVMDVLKRILDIKKKLLGPDNPITLTIQEKIAIALYKQEKYENVLKLLNKIQRKRKDLFGSYNSDYLDTQCLIALTLYRQRNYHEALRIFEDTYVKQKDFLGENHVDVLKTLSHMTLVLDKVNRSEEALTINRKIFEAYSEIFGVEDRSTIMVQNNIAMTLLNSGKYQEAEDVFRKVYTLRKKILGLHHTDTLRALFNMVKSQINTFSHSDFQMKSDDILKTLQSIFEVQTAVLTQYHTDTLNTELEMGNVLFYSGRFRKALDVYSENLMKQKCISCSDYQTLLFLEKQIESIQSMTPIRYAHLIDMSDRWEPFIHAILPQLQEVIASDLP